MMMRCLSFLVLVTTCSCQLHIPPSCLTDLRFSRDDLTNTTYYHKLLTDVIASVGWSTVTIIYDAYAETIVDIGELAHTLHTQRIKTRVVEQTAVLESGNIRSLDILMGYVEREKMSSSEADSFLLVGDSPFVLQVLEKMSSIAFKSKFSSEAQPSPPNVTRRYLSPLTTEWLILMQGNNITSVNPLLSDWDHVIVIDSSETGVTLRTLQRSGDATRLIPLKSDDSGVFPYSRQELFPNLAQGLSNRTLRVVVKEVNYLMMKVDGKSGPEYQGVLMELLDQLSRRLNFSYTIQGPPDDSWGQELDNDQWDGLIGMLTRKESDLALGPFRVTKSRVAIADATRFYDFTRAVLIFRTSGTTTDNSNSFFLRPLQTEVYSTLGGCMAIVLLLLSLSRLCEWYVKGLQGTKPTLTQRMISDVEMTFAALLNKAHEWSISPSRAGHVIMITWMYIGLVVMGFSYCSQLTARLTIHDVRLPFTSLEELVNQDVYRWGARNGTAVKSAMQTSNIDIYKKFYDGATQFSRTDPDVWSPFDDVHFRKVLSSNYVFLSANEKIFYQMRSQTCDLASVDVPGFSSPAVFYLQKDSPFTRLFSEVIATMLGAGLVTKALQKWKPEAKHCAPRDSSLAISVEKVKTAFYVLGIGVGLALTTLTVETLLIAVRRQSCFLSGRREVEPPTTTPGVRNMHSE